MKRAYSPFEVSDANNNNAVWDIIINGTNNEGGYKGLKSQLKDVDIIIVSMCNKQFQNMYCGQESQNHYWKPLVLDQFPEYKNDYQFKVNPSWSGLCFQYLKFKQSETEAIEKISKYCLNILESRSNLRNINQLFSHLLPFINHLALPYGNPIGQLCLGVCYQNGFGVAIDENEAFKYKMLSANQKYSKAEAEVGGCYMDGKGTAQNFDESIKYYKLAAEQGDAWAQLTLGNIYFNVDIQEAVRYYKLAADQGYSDAQYHLAILYCSGNGLPQNLEEAFKYLKLAADQGHSGAQYKVALHYAKEGIDKDPAQAFNYMKLAADQGDVLAQNHLGIYYNKGFGVAINFDEAFKYIKLAADKENINAHYNLGLLHFHGQGTPQNFTLAFTYFQFAAYKGNVAAQKQIGDYYLEGIGGGIKDINLAIKYYELAATKNHDAAFILYKIYDEGTLIAKNDELSFKFCKLAADQGHSGASADQKYAAAQCYLGACYQHAKGVKENPEEAFRYYELAAAQGHRLGQLNLSKCYKIGYGVTQDDAKALHYHKLSITQK